VRPRHRRPCVPWPRGGLRTRTGLLLRPLRGQRLLACWHVRSRRRRLHDPRRMLQWLVRAQPRLREPRLPRLLPARGRPVCARAGLLLGRVPCGRLRCWRVCEGGRRVHGRRRLLLARLQGWPLCPRSRRLLPSDRRGLQLGGWSVLLRGLRRRWALRSRPWPLPRTGRSLQRRERLLPRRLRPGREQSLHVHGGVCGHRRRLRDDRGLLRRLVHANAGQMSGPYERVQAPRRRLRRRRRVLLRTVLRCALR
jgi:hypothetical protein